MNPSNDRRILVTGATGTQGGAVARQLLARGHRGRALCRDPESEPAGALARAGVDIRRGDLDDPDSLSAALEDISGVFAVHDFWDGFPAKKLGAEGELRQGKHLVDAARAAGVRHLVLSTGGGVTIAPELEVNRGKLAIEEHARASGVPLTIVRPVFFMENFDNPAWGMRDALLDGRLDLPFAPDTGLQMLASEDLGHLVTMAFERPEEFVGCTFDLAGDRMTMLEIAETFSRVMGRTVEFSGSPEGLAYLEQMDADLGTLFRVEIYQRGFRAFLPALRALHPGMLRLEDYLQRAGWVGR